MQADGLRRAAAVRGLKLHVLHASTAGDIDGAFDEALRLRADGFVVGTNALFNTHLARLAALGLRHAIPTIFQHREFAAAGGLVGYGGANAETNRLAGSYAGRILKGEKPADLPVQQATKVELILNLKTAKALGITVPVPLLGRADEVIE
jgi:putative ABC transport system substrate-binding protein